jgi:hypothetical protein
MGVRIIEGVKINEEDRPAAVLYDSTDNRALPFVFDSAEEAQSFLDWLGGDPRRSTRFELDRLFNNWVVAGKPAKAVG